MYAELYRNISPMKYALVVLILLHALIHLMGFAKEWKLAEVSQLSGHTLFHLGEQARRITGILWLLACLVFIVSALALLAGGDNWWMWAAVALVLSQVLIVLYWKDARAGTIANVLILVAVWMAYGQARFHKMVSREEAMLGTHVQNDRRVVTADMWQHLPQPVQRWMQSSGVAGKTMPHIVYLEQSGKMRTKPEQDWMNVAATQYFNADTPAFVWKVHTRMMKVVDVSGRDKYIDGQGNMLIKAFGSITMVDGKGPETDQGTMLRYLGEICWFPSAALRDYISWTDIDSNSAKATMTYMGRSVSAVFRFDDNGRLQRIDAKRYMGAGKDAQLQDWYVLCTAWQKFSGVTVPVSGSVLWKLSSGDFDYYRWHIDRLEYR